MSELAPSLRVCSRVNPPSWAGIWPRRRLEERSRTARSGRETREGGSGPLRAKFGRESELTRPSWQETPTQLQWGVDFLHERRTSGFSSPILKEMRASASGFSSFW